MKNVKLMVTMAVLTIEGDVVDITEIHIGENGELQFKGMFGRTYTEYFIQKEDVEDIKNQIDMLEMEIDGAEYYDGATLALNEQLGTLDIRWGVDHTVEIDGEEFKIYDDDDRQEAVCMEVSETLWTYSPNFLAEVTKIPESVFKAIASNDRCVGNNATIMEVIEATCGMDKVVETAISWDGYGYHLSSADGEELEIQLGDTEYLYLYRQ